MKKSLLVCTFSLLAYFIIAVAMGIYEYRQVSNARVIYYNTLANHELDRIGKLMDKISINLNKQRKIKDEIPKDN